MQDNNSTASASICGTILSCVITVSHEEQYTQNPKYKVAALFPHKIKKKLKHLQSWWWKICLYTGCKKIQVRGSVLLGKTFSSWRWPFFKWETPVLKPAVEWTENFTFKYVFRSYDLNELEAYLKVHRLFAWDVFEDKIVALVVFNENTENR